MTAFPRPANRLSPLLTLPLLLTACAGLSLTPDPLPTLFVLPTLTPPPATAVPQPIPTPTADAAPLPDPSPAVTLPPCRESEGQVLESTYPSDIAQQDVSYLIYLPPCYSTSGKRYPVLYMLHGLGEGMDHTQWDEIGLDEAADVGYRRGALPPLIIVMPDGTVHLPADATNTVHGRDDFSPATSYEYMIVNELMPAVESDYCAWSERAGRAIGGLSRGGFWAYEIALRHPELFSAVGGHSAAFYEDSTIPPANNPLHLATEAQGIEELRMYLDHGVGDYDWVEEAIALFSARLAERGIEHTYVVNPVGGHDESYWAAHVADYLSFYAAQWPQDIEFLPSCMQQPGG